MKYKFSAWDVVVFGLTVIGLALRTPEWVIVPLVIYVPTRLMDLLLVARHQPGRDRFLTNAGGGWAVTGSLLIAERDVASLVPIPPGPAVATLLLALGYVYTGLLFIFTPSERIPRNIAASLGGSSPTAPAAERTLGHGLGIGLIVGGIGAAALGFLPGQLWLLSIAGFLIGPIVGLVVGNSGRSTTLRR